MLMNFSILNVNWHM